MCVYNIKFNQLQHTICFSLWILLECNWTHWKRPWSWERLKAGREGDDRGWDGWMASLTQWTWVWAKSCEGHSEEDGEGQPGVLQSVGLQSADMTYQLNNKGDFLILPLQPKDNYSNIGENFLQELYFYVYMYMHAHNFFTDLWSCFHTYSHILFIYLLYILYICLYILLIQSNHLPPILFFMNWPDCRKYTVQ